MRVVIALLVAGVAAIVQPGEPRAQTAGANQVETRMRAYTASAPYLELVRSALARIPATVFPRCPQLVLAPSLMMFIKPIAFAEGAGPTAGMWKQSFPVSGCGNDTTLNIYFTAEGGQTRSVVGLPGTTQAELVLQRDALSTVSISAKLRIKDCNSLELTNTRFEEFGLKNPPTPDPGQGARFRPWWETWTVKGCNQAADIRMNFVPDATGTAFSVVTTPADRK
jgi:hypothetical protein